MMSIEDIEKLSDFDLVLEISRCSVKFANEQKETNFITSEFNIFLSVLLVRIVIREIHKMVDGAANHHGIVERRNSTTFTDTEFASIQKDPVKGDV